MSAQKKRLQALFATFMAVACIFGFLIAPVSAFALDTDDPTQTEEETAGTENELKDQLDQDGQEAVEAGSDIQDNEDKGLEKEADKNEDKVLENEADKKDEQEPELNRGTASPPVKAGNPFGATDEDISVASDGYYEVKTKTGFLAAVLLLSASDTSDLKIRMMTDVDFSEFDDCRISAGTFSGTFDGNSHTFSNVEGVGGLFNEIGSGGTVKNLNLKIKSIKCTESRCGGVTATNNGTIENCHVELGEIYAVHATGGVAGYNKGTVTKCTVMLESGKIYTTADSGSRMSGGIAGDNSSGSISWCRTYGSGDIYNVTGDGGSGGIAGWNYASISSCIFEGSIKVHNERADFTGGISGYSARTISDCLVTGDVIVGYTADGNYVGGIVGKRISNKISHCFYDGNNVPLRGSHAILGYNDGGSTEDCYYNADKGSFTDDGATALHSIYWLECDSSVTADFGEGDSLTFAGRNYVYSGKTVTLSYNGTLGNNQTVVFKLNGNTVGDSISMPSQKSYVTAEVITQINISGLNPYFDNVTYNGQEQSPGTLHSDNGDLSNGTDFTIKGFKSGGTSAQCINAGDYVAEIEGKGLYNGTANVSLKVEKADPAFNTEPKAVNTDYTGSDIALLTEGTATGGTVMYKHQSGEYGTVVPTGKDAKDYPVAYMIKGDANHKDSAEYKVTSTINKVSAAVKKEPAANILTYNESDQALVTEGETEDGTMMYALDSNADFEESVPTGKDAKAYSVYYKVKGDKNHNDSEIYGPVSVTINKAEPETITKPSAKTLVSNGKKQQLINKGTVKGGKILYKVGEGDYSETVPKESKVGTYSVFWKIEGDSNHNDSQEFGPVKARIITAAPMAKVVHSGKRKLVLSWNKTAGADGYDIFFSKCRKDPKLVATVNGSAASWKSGKLKKTTAYKMYVKAFILKDGVKTYLTTTPEVHAYTGGYTKNYTNAKSVKTNATSVSLGRGKTFALKVTVTKLKGKKKLMTNHTSKVRYVSSDNSIATVNKAGVITGKSKGKCTIYAYAHNGVRKAISVSVD